MREYSVSLQRSNGMRAHDRAQNEALNRIGAGLESIADALARLAAVAEHIVAEIDDADESGAR